LNPRIWFCVHKFSFGYWSACSCQSAR